MIRKEKNPEKQKKLCQTFIFFLMEEMIPSNL